MLQGLRLTGSFVQIFHSSNLQTPSVDNFHRQVTLVNRIACCKEFFGHYSVLVIVYDAHLHERRHA